MINNLSSTLLMADNIEAAEMVVVSIFTVIGAGLTGAAGLIYAWRKKLKPEIDALRNSQDRVVHQTENHHTTNLRDDIDNITELVKRLGATQEEQTAIINQLNESVMNGKDSDLKQWERVAKMSVDINDLRDRLDTVEQSRYKDHTDEE